MATTKCRNGVAILLASMLALFASDTPVAAQPTPSSPESLVDAAKSLAGKDLLPVFDFFCIAGNARPNNFSAPALQPVQLFDNLYAVGNSETVVYALTTTNGIVLIDSGHPDNIDTVVLPGLVKLGLNPANIKYVLLGHGHSDHYGGAAVLQQRFGARIAAAAADWDTIAAEKPSQLFGDAPKPARDMVLREGEPLVVGDTTITLVAIPGHTPGSLAFIFPVRDGGKPHIAGMFGGTVLAQNYVPVPALKQYVASIAHYIEVARTMRVDVEIQNHPIFDATPKRLAALATRKPGELHPFVLGNEPYLRFWQVVSTCMQAEIVRRETVK